MSFLGLFNKEPTVPNDVQKVLDNAEAVVSSTNVIESDLAVATMTGLEKMDSSTWGAIMTTYMGAGEVAFSLSGTTAQRQAAAVGGGDTVLNSEGVTANLIPESVKCALVHAGMAAVSVGQKHDVTEALQLAVKAAMPSA